MSKTILTGGYAGVSSAHLEVAKHYSSPFLVGPPLCDELVALVKHMFTEEEAEVARHLKPLRARTAGGLAKASGRTLPEVNEIMARLAHEKFVLASVGNGPRELYSMMPILPGTFELVMTLTDPGAATPWHKRFAELYEALINTGYLPDYFNKPVDGVRYLPVGESIEGNSMAYPSDKLEVILDRYKDFAVSNCSCRLTKQLLDEGCGKMLETCAIMGEAAPYLVSQGKMRTATRQEILDIKREAEKQGLICYTMNEESGRLFGNICSCCACCCGALRTISQFNAPGFIAPPHFMPRVDESKCKKCGKCAAACQMKALVSVDEGEAKRPLHEPHRCIGCGLCAVACPNGSISMQAVPGYKAPPKGWPSYLAKYGPRFLTNTLKVRSSRKSL